MGVVEEGPVVPDTGWHRMFVQFVAYIVATDEDSSTGASVQKSGDARSGMEDQTVGKVGPLIGVWAPEKANRMIQEF